MHQRLQLLRVAPGDATGGAIARRFAREGYVAGVARRNAEKLEPLVQAIRDQGGEALAGGCDARQQQ
ncbi:short-chain dehydrogenase, partial [Pseudomonas aeruginosa]